MRVDCILSSYLFNLNTENILKEFERKHVFKIRGRHINKVCYGDDITQGAKKSKDLKALVIKVKDYNEKKRSTITKIR